MWHCFKVDIILRNRCEVKSTSSTREGVKFLQFDSRGEKRI